ncbi:hypothetical protein CYMTET_56496 [Cymbomonas tetramitiformis]|uniref:Uncharacterized protein n=1 Tax=Cymbomonas tetramitiformis TaxID=36881 RepID=A0AAE0ENP8_9CHLO|nr:hypothetical protein CYMTET_56496 [Cymbomonas tetramitiformis]
MLTAWHWKRDLYSLPLEVAMQKVRRALRKSPEAAKDLVDKMWERTRSRIRSGSRSPKEHVNRANQLAERVRIAREPQDRREGHQRIALWHLLSHDGRQQALEPPSVSPSDLYAAWRELSPAEQLEAIATSMHAHSGVRASTVLLAARDDVATDNNGASYHYTVDGRIYDRLLGWCSGFLRRPPSSVRSGLEKKDQALPALSVPSPPIAVLA